MNFYTTVVCILVIAAILIYFDMMPANQYQKEKILQDLECDDFEYLQVHHDNSKLIILRTSNIVSITIKGDADDGKGLS